MGRSELRRAKVGHAIASDPGMLRIDASSAAAATAAAIVMVAVFIGLCR